jgi:hypothetical protein
VEVHWDIRQRETYSWARQVLYPSLMEAALWRFTGTYNSDRLAYGVNRIQQWYLGDGLYQDGTSWQFNYYTAMVIHPWSLEILGITTSLGNLFTAFQATEVQRAQRHARWMEEMISPEGTYPVYGRSAVYRLAVFHNLGLMFLRRQAPGELSPGPTRAALLSVMRKMGDDPDTWNGPWLRAGIVGFQPGLADDYISTGSVYFTSLGFVTLGLPETDAFWTAAGGPWTQRRIWWADPNVLADQRIARK